MEREQRGLQHEVDGDLVHRFYDALPYGLTGAQRRVIGEIEADLAGPHPMHRLLQGDVGSGKTVVAVATMLAAVQGGHQAALMAPTEVLADQHATGVRALLGGVSVPDPDNLFGDRPLRVELLTNRVTGFRPQGGPGRPGRRHGRHRDRHACADPGRGRLRQPRRRGRRRTTPFRCRAAGGPSRQDGRRCRSGHAGDDGDPDPADRSHDRVRRSRRQRPRRTPTRAHPDRHEVGRRPAARSRGVGRHPLAGRRRPAGLCGVSVDRREREVGSGLGRGDIRTTRGGRARRSPARACCTGACRPRRRRRRWMPSEPGSWTCWWRPP